MKDYNMVYLLKFFKLFEENAFEVFRARHKNDQTIWQWYKKKKNPQEKKFRKNHTKIFIADYLWSITLRDIHFFKKMENLEV